MRRSSWSRPVALALAHEVLTPEQSFFDYGCGHGDDFRSLKAQGFDAVGWDPLNFPQGTRRRSDVVNLGYVLNVIERTPERAQVLRDAFQYAKDILIVAVRVDRTLRDATAYGDGVVTKRNTFQKIFTQSELREYVAEVLGCEPVLADIGVAYVFRSEEAEARYISNRAFGQSLRYNHYLRQRFLDDEDAQALIARTAALGRIPHPDEFEAWDELSLRFGGAARIGRLLLSAVDAEAFAGSARERAQDLLIYLAKMRLAGVRTPKFSVLPRAVQLDLRSTWGSLKRAQDEALVLLFSLGREEIVRDAIRQASVGKRVGDALYVHSSALDSLPPVLRLAEFAARRVVGEVDAEVVKFAERGRAVSFLRYPDFDTDAHPGLRSSIRVYLPRRTYAIREYGSVNPFILHRKELFVSADYPGRDSFAALTRTEEAAELLSAPDIGTRKAWNATLAAHGFMVVGHKLLGEDGQLAPFRLHPPTSLPLSNSAPPSPPAKPNPVRVPLTETPPTMSKTPSQLLEAFCSDIRSMKVHKGKNGISPKKPGLLLVVLEMIDDRTLIENKIRLPVVEPRLAAKLQELAGKKVGGLTEPFVRMESSPFWTVHGLEGGSATKRALGRDGVWAEFVPSGLFDALRNTGATERVRAVVVDTWLPAIGRNPI